MAMLSSHDSVSLVAGESQGCLGKQTEWASLEPRDVWAQSRDGLSCLVTLASTGHVNSFPQVYWSVGATYLPQTWTRGLTKDRDWLSVHREFGGAGIHPSRFSPQCSPPSLSLGVSLSH